MLDFCPLCNKNGYKRKIILRQINLQEAVWLCEYSECPWPFGSEDFTFVSRKVGETWSSEWELRKPAISKSSESIQISLAELGLDTPPVTPGSGTEVVHKDSVFVENTSSVTSQKKEVKPNSGSLNNSKRKLGHFKTSEDGSVDTESKRSKINDVYNSDVNVINIDRDFKNQESLNCDNPNFKDEKTSRECKNGFTLTDDSNSETLDKCVSASRGSIDACDAADALTKSVFNISSKPSIDNLPIHESTVKCKKWLSDNTKATVIGNLCYLSESKKLDIGNGNAPSEVLDIRLKSNSVKNSDSVKRLPKIKSIKKTNVRLEEVIPNFIQQRFKEEINSSLANVGKIVNHPVVVTDLTETVKIETEEKLKRTNSDDFIVLSNNSTPNIYPDHEMSFKNCKLQNKTIAIDGLFPIKLSYEIPSFLENSITVPCSADYSKKAKEENVDIELGQESTVVNNSVMSIDVKIETADCFENKNNESSISDKRKQSIKKPLKRTVPKLKGKYQGFSFGVLKKKCKTNIANIEDNMKSSIPNVLSPDNVSSCSDVTWTSETSSATTTTVDSRSESVDSGVYTDSKSNLNIENYSPGTLSSDLIKSSSTFSPQNDGTLESSFNLDQVIDDLLLSETEDLTKSFQDDWLESLFQ